jgi:hypothetical protein
MDKIQESIYSKYFQFITAETISFFIVIEVSRLEAVERISPFIPQCHQILSGKVLEKPLHSFTPS